MTMNEQNHVNESLQKLVAEACSHPAKSEKRQGKLKEIVQVLMKSDQLWIEDTFYYEDALQQTWLYLCKNPERYDPARGTVINWLNKYLKWRLEDLRQASWNPEVRTVDFYMPKTKEMYGQIEMNNEATENLLAPPYIPPILEETRIWVETDSSGELRKTHVKNRPEVNCQILILLRLPPETRWETIAKKLQVAQSTAQTFYRREAWPRLQKFGLEQGYLG